MKEKPSCRQAIRTLLVEVGIFVACTLGIALIFVEVKTYGTGFKGKTLWDWLQLLIIPAVLALGGFWFSQIQKSRDQRTTQQQAELERELTRDNQQETLLQAYLDKMSELLLEKNLRESDPEAEVRGIARVRTLTVLQRLDGKRKGSVLTFLHESSLINKNKRIINLIGADLNGADLVWAQLSEADLGGTNLRGANLNIINLNGANLNGANLNGANLYRAELNEADLNGAELGNAKLSLARLNRANLSNVHHSGKFTSGGSIELHLAHLSGANLSNADLAGADLSNVDLSEARLEDADLSRTNLLGAVVTQEQLDQAKSLQGATMPDGSIHP